MFMRYVLTTVENWEVSSVAVVVEFSQRSKCFKLLVTDSTLRRSQLLSEMMEMLQMLKFQFRSEQLDFNNNWVSSEGKLSIMDISPEVVEEMIWEQRISDLDDLIDSSFIQL